MRSRNIQITKFNRGMLRDGIADADRLLSLRDLVNYDIDNENGALIKRNGYQRYHSQALADSPEQLYHYVDTDGNENDLCIADGKLYWVDPLASHIEIQNWSSGSGVSLSFTSGTKYPFIILEDGRCVFADDGDVYWTDNTEVTSGKCYQLGIDKPDIDAPIGLISRVAYGYEDSNAIIGNNLTSTIQIGQSFQLATALTIDAVRLYCAKTGFVNRDGGVILHIYADDGGEPDTANSIASCVLDMSVPVESLFSWVRFSFDILVTLDASTTYWIVIDGDDGYDEHYDISNLFSWKYYNAFGDGKAMYYDGSWHDYSPGIDYLFQLGGQLEEDSAYKYKFTYYNNTYVSESEPISPHGTDSNLGISTTDSGTDFDDKTTITISQIPVPTDGQVTHVRVYRTKADETTPYYYINQVVNGTTSYIDVIADVNLDNQLLSDISQRPLDTDGNKLVPRYMAIYNSRLILAKVNDNILYYSQRIDKDGALGYVGEPLYDAFHAECFEKLPVPDVITGMLPVGNMLAVYFENSIWRLWGMDEALNPPGDLSVDEQVSGTGCIAPVSIVSIDPSKSQAKHYFLSRTGIHTFDGYDTERISEDKIQSIIDALSVTEKANSVGVAVGGMYWLSTTDNEGQWGAGYGNDIYGDDIYGGQYDSANIIIIYDEREIWRKYKFYHSINHIICKQSGSLAGQVLIAPAESYCVMKMVDSVYSDVDNDNVAQNIIGFIETQRLRALTTMLPYTPRSPFSLSPSWHHLFVDIYHAGAPVYFIDVIDKDGAVTTPTLNITSDKRSQQCGFRVVSDECRFRVRQLSKTRDEIRGLIATWTEK